MTAGRLVAFLRLSREMGQSAQSSGPTREGEAGREPGRKGFEVR